MEGNYGNEINLPGGQIEHFAGIARGLRRDFLESAATHLGQGSEHLGQVRGAVALATVAGDREVGRVGLEHQRLGRQVTRQGTQLARALEGQHAAEAEPETEIEVLPGLLQAAVEGVGDATGNPRAAQRGEYLVVRLAHVQQHRQPRRGGDRQLRVEQRALALGIGIVDVEVETDLADGHGVAGGQFGLEGREIGLAVRGDVDRVQAVRSVQVGVRRAQRPQPRPAGGRHRGDDDAAHATGAARGEHRGTVGVEGVDIEMAVGVDQLQRSAPGIPAQNSVGAAPGRARPARFATRRLSRRAAATMPKVAVTVTIEP